MATGVVSGGGVAWGGGAATSARHYRLSRRHAEGNETLVRTAAAQVRSGPRELVIIEERDGRSRGVSEIRHPDVVEYLRQARVVEVNRRVEHCGVPGL